MLPISPHTESTGISGAEGPQKPKAEKSAIGVFAKILAGLQGKSLSDRGLGKKNGESAAIDPQKLQLAASVDGASGGKGKSVSRSSRVDTEKAAAAEKKETKKLLKNGETALKSPKSDFSEQDKNVLLAVGRLAGQSEELPGKVKSKGDFEQLTANVRRSGEESVKTKTALAELAEGAERQMPGQKPLTTSAATFAAQEPVENSKTVQEKAKNRNARMGENLAENGIKNNLAAESIVAEALSQRTEVKKAVPGEKDGKSKVEEARGKKRGLSFEVQDFRTEQAAGKDSVPLRVGAETRVSGDTTKEITLELHLPEQGQNSSSANAAATTSWEAKAGQAFEDLLARELHQNFNNDIVRHASVALRDNNEGTIRLALKPESLGNVKIRLEMAENRITGHIVVESEEALRAFEREISSLEQAFRDSGFEGANLEMSLAADGRGAQQQWQEAEASQFLPGQIAASRYDAAVERMEIPLTLDVYQQGTRAINVLA